MRTVVVTREGVTTYAGDDEAAARREYEARSAAEGVLYAFLYVGTALVATYSSPGAAAPRTEAFVAAIDRAVLAERSRSCDAAPCSVMAELVAMAGTVRAGDRHGGPPAGRD